MEHISEGQTSGMRPEQTLKGLAKTVEGDIFDFLFADNNQEMDDDDLSFFGVGGPA
jgi:hypothetical protein